MAQQWLPVNYSTPNMIPFHGGQNSPNLYNQVGAQDRDGSLFHEGHHEGHFGAHAPGPIRGSVDFILIPMILIGIAGPIIVVCYLILGASSYQLQLTTATGRRRRRSLSNLLSPMGRALDEDDCLHYVICQFGTFIDGDSNERVQEISRILATIVPSHYYQKKFNRVAKALAEGKDEECSVVSCASQIYKNSNDE